MKSVRVTVHREERGWVAQDREGKAQTGYEPAKPALYRRIRASNAARRRWGAPELVLSNRPQV